MELTRVPSQSNSSPRIAPPSSSRELIFRVPPIICARVAAQHGAPLCWRLMMGTPHLPAPGTAGAAAVHALAAWGCSTVWGTGLRHFRTTQPAPALRDAISAAGKQQRARRENSVFRV